MKRIRYINGSLDDQDIALLDMLSANARTPVKDLARHVGLSAPSTAERLRRLEEAGVIQGYTVRIDPRAIGLPLAIMIRLRPMPGELARVVELVKQSPEIIECDRVTGDDCFVAKAFVANVVDLEEIIDRFLPYATTNTAIIQSSPVSRRMPQVKTSPDQS